MTLSAYIDLLIRGAFVLLFIFSVRDLWRHRDRLRLGIAAMLGSLAIVGIAGRLSSPNEGIQRFLETAVILGLISHPYLILRLVASYLSIPRLVQWLAAGGLALAWLIVLFGGPSVPGALVPILIAYFVSIEGYAAVVLLRGARATGGVSRWRLSLIAAGSLMLAMAVLLLLVRNVAPLLTGLNDLLTMIAALSYYLGFAPPRWLRRAWQLNELHRFLRRQGGRSIDQNVRDILANTCYAAGRSVGALATMALLGEKTDKSLDLVAADGVSLDAVQLTLAEDGAVTRAWRMQRPEVGQTLETFGLLEAGALASATAASVLFAIPIVTTIHRPGLLLVFLRSVPLFAEDDHKMLTLFAEQSAVTLDNLALLAEQRDLVEKLVQNETRLEELVAQRTAELSRTNEQLAHEAAERRRAANALQQLNEQLEQRVLERTKELEIANQELESFAYSVSHDLRAPLRAIDGFSQALLEDCADQIDELGQDYLARVRANTQRMGELIDALLKLSRMSRVEMQVECVDLSALAHSTAAEIRRRDAARQVEFSIAPDLKAQGDARLLQVVLWNLFENAWKFTSGCDRARIEFGATEGDGERAYFVRDDGVGFDMTYADKLFGAFQRLHGLNEFEGTGIGLATVQRIVHRHHGRVWAEAVPDEGATFFFTLASVEK